jgi:hypothetical protein
MDVAKGPKLDYVSIEMSGASLSVLLNQGTINLWFGRNADRSLVQKILLLISKVDSTAEHERETICSFESISDFENCGYILISYARKKDKYKAVFLIPFSNPRAIDKFIESVHQDLNQGEVRVALSWRGGRARMNILRTELGRLNCFTFSNIIYKEDSPKAIKSRSLKE